MELKVIDLFAGGGGFSLGFQNAGYSIIAAFDNWIPAIEVYGNNFTHPIIHVDLSNGKSLNEIEKFKFNVIIGGPPCQDFSSAGKRNENLGRANLTINFVNIIKETVPKFFVMENVARALKSDTMAKAIKMFKKIGYGLTIKVLDASLCGVPQIRKRLFVIGEFGGKDDFLLKILELNVDKKAKSLRDFFGDTLGVEHYYRHPRSYKRRGVFSIDEPSPTIRSVNRPIPSGYSGHPGDTALLTNNVRPLTTKERSLIQTFPDDFKLLGSKTVIEQVIGNAVPVKLAEYVAKCLKIYIKGQ